MPNLTPAAEKRPDLSIIIVNYNTAQLLDRLFRAIEAARGPLELQLAVVDNGSQDNSVAVLRERCPGATVIANTANAGFGRANNQAVAHAEGRYVLLLNTDAFVSPDTFCKTIAFMDAHPECGILGVKLVDEHNVVQPSCRFFPTPWSVFLSSTGLFVLFPGTRLVDDPAWNPSCVRECDWVPGCYYLVRREVIDQIGFFDPRFFLYYEEVDHCRRAKAAGWTVCYYPDTQVTHIGGQSAIALGKVARLTRQIPALQIESELLYFRKHHGLPGILAAVMLTLFAECIGLVRRTVRGSRRERLRIATQHLRIFMNVLAKTRFGSMPTR